MKLPSFTELKPEQLAIYEQPADKSILVVGPPGSGKTSLAIWRARFIAAQGKSVVLLTRNRLLVALASQLASEHGGQSVQTSTMHSYAWNEYRKHFAGTPPKVGEFEYDWPAFLAQYAAKGIGHALDHLIVDEGQNLPPQFFVWARRFCASAVSVFADEHQTTTVGGSTMADFQAAGFTSFFPLLENHRNTWEIAKLASNFHCERKLPGAATRREVGAERPRLIKIANWADLVGIIGVRLTNRGGSIGVITYRKADVTEVHKQLKAALGTERVSSYKSGMYRGAELIQMRDRGVTVISGESAIGLEFETVYLQDLSRSLPRTSQLDDRRLYMLSARARDFLYLVNGPQSLTAAQLAALPPSPDLER